MDVGDINKAKQINEWLFLDDYFFFVFEPQN